MNHAFTTAQLDILFDAVPTLKLGALGHDNAWRHISLALEAAHADTAHNTLFGRFVTELGQWALQDAPLDENLLWLACNHPPLEALVHRLPVEAWLQLASRPPTGSPGHDGWLETCDTDVLRAALRAAQATQEHILFRVRALFHRTLALGQFDLARETVAALPPDLPGREPLAVRLLAECALLSWPPEEALAAVRQVEHPAFSLWRDRKTAYLLNRLGDKDGAVTLYSSLWRQLGFHPNLSLRLHDLLFPQPDIALPDGETAPAIALYSWNKAEELRQTLESLRASDTGGCPIFVLDNGSTDHTAAVLDAMQRQWPEHLFRRIALPVNIGAPAARNWLLSLPEIKARPWTAFLDDDLVLPADWLRLLWSTACAHPQAGAVGGTITDHTPPHRIQCADFFLLPTEFGQRSFADLAEQTYIHANAAGLCEPDLARYIRPCLHVSGCCHLVNMRSVEACGGFDVRFTPSQFDDLERDMRAFGKGFPCVYNGNVRIGHMQHSSLRQAATREQRGRVLGNKIKLEFIHQGKAAEHLRETARLMARDDLKQKTDSLHRLLGQ